PEHGLGRWYLDDMREDRTRTARGSCWSVFADDHLRHHKMREPRWARHIRTPSIKPPAAELRPLAHQFAKHAPRACRSRVSTIACGLRRPGAESAAAPKYMFMSGSRPSSDHCAEVYALMETPCLILPTAKVLFHVLADGVTAQSRQPPAPAAR